LLAAVPAGADILWEASYGEAVERARTEHKLLFVAVNMDGEGANDYMADKVYHDKRICELTASTVNVIASRFSHGASDSTCKRFGTITCAEHQFAEKGVRGAAVKPSKDGHIIAPQHVFLDPGGEVLMSVPYLISAEELEWCLIKALNEVHPEAQREIPEEAHAPMRLVAGRLYDPEAGQPAPRPLGKEELEETIKELQSGFGALENMNAFSRLLVTDEPDAVKYAIQEVNSGLLTYTSSMNTSLVRTIGMVSPESFWEVVEPMLKHRDENVRSEAAVCLEQLGARKSVKAIQAALSKEKDPHVKKNLLRALGTAGRAASGPEKVLLRYAKDDRDGDVMDNALMALGMQAQRLKVRKFLLDRLAEGSEREQQAIAVGLAFGRQSAYKGELEGLAAKAPSGDLAGVLQRALEVLDGGSLTVIAEDVTRIGHDRVRRERFFGSPKEQ
jgi:hypothetical protein